MDDLIEREALLDEIQLAIEDGGCVNHEHDIMDCIRYAPTVDAVPVVRCKDCMLRGGYDCPMQYAIEWGIGNTPPDDDDYCSTGQKRMDADAPERGKDGRDG